jgi:hypothetical protein
MSPVDRFKKVLAERARIQLLALTSPDTNKVTDKTLLKGLIPNGWEEIVYEYSDKFIVHLTNQNTIPKTEEMSLMTLIRRELGNNNVICSMVENTQESSSITIQLKKSNYIEEVLALS